MRSTSLSKYRKRRSYEGLEKVTSTLGPIVTAIIGYYFGQQPVQAAEERAKRGTMEYSQHVDQDISERERFQQAIDALREQLETINNKLRRIIYQCQ